MFRVDKDKCTGCRACLSVCPAGAISMVDGKAVVDDSRCTNCAKCVQVCLPGAIYSTGQSGQSAYPAAGAGDSGRGVGRGGGRGLGRGPRDGRGGGRGGGGGRGR
ncbi:MAG: 4Fe-4S binding protein [Candidatus Sabulitectum sp.]|nr:4Fe-4S binding protein [Candidatus Sabulitectum sp.]